MSSAYAAILRHTPVTVETIRIRHVHIPFKKTIKHASHTRNESDNVVVECRLSDGTIGYGEGVPREYVTGETIDTSLDLLRRTDWSGQLSRAASFPHAVEMIEEFRLPAVAGDERDCIGNAARCAAELALLDAYARSFEVSLQSLASELPVCRDIADQLPYCRYSGAITSKPTLVREILSALKMRLNRFRHMKIKVGTEGQNDVRRLFWFRQFLGLRMDFRIDANEAWTPENVVAKIQELEPYTITCVEQPVAHEQVGCLAEVRKQVKTPIMLDESLCSYRDGERAIQAGTCDIFNIRLSKCGGLIPSLKLAALANENGLRYQLGCQVGETGILSAAGRHFACSVRGIRYLEGSYDRYLVRERLTREDLTFEWRGIAPALTGPGLGVHVEPERLASVTVREELVYG